MDNFFSFKEPASLRINIEAISSLIITDTRGDANVVKTKEYINGSAILGLFAKIYLKSTKLDEEFYRLFLRGGLLFTNGYISYGEKADSYPLPMSMEKDKHPEKQGSIKAYDFIYMDERNISEINNEAVVKKKPITGFGYIKTSTDKNYVNAISVNTSINFHNSINNGQKDNTIFNYESIQKGQTFVSFIIGEISDLSNMADLLRRYLSDKDYVYIGRSKSSQYGKAFIKWNHPMPYENTYPIKTVESNESKIVITFLSDTIVYNDFGFSTVDVDVLSKYLGVKILNQATRKSYVENFVAAWKIKKPSENMFISGSSFLLEKLPNNYKKLELYGLGERTSEGFGRIAFNIQKTKNADYIFDKLQEPKFNKPGIIPDTAKDLVIYAIKSMIEEEIIIGAIKEAGDADNISNSLIGRLLGFISNYAYFKTSIENLRPTAKKQIEYAGIESRIISNSHISLIQYFKDLEENLKKFIIELLDNKYKINDYCNDIGFKYEGLKLKILGEIEMQNFIRLFLFNFLTQLKRKNKISKNDKLYE